MSLKHKWSIFSMKEEQSIIFSIRDRRKRNNLWAEYDDISKQIWYLQEHLETNGGLKWKSLKVAHDEQLDKVLFYNLMLQLFLINIHIFDYSDYFV